MFSAYIILIGFNFEGLRMTKLSTALKNIIDAIDGGNQDAINDAVAAGKVALGRNPKADRPQKPVVPNTIIPGDENDAYIFMDPIGRVRVDVEDLPKLTDTVWVCSYDGYAVANHHIPSMRFSMHRVIMDAPKGVIVDHISGDKLDNRKSNLRFATAGQNAMNRTINRTNKSGYKGVVFIKKSGKWRASIGYGGKKFWIGEYKTPEEAAFYYNQAAKKHHGEFANLNAI